MKLENHLRTRLGDLENSIRKFCPAIIPAISGQPRKTPKFPTCNHHYTIPKGAHTNIIEGVNAILFRVNEKLPDFSPGKTANRVMQSPERTTWVSAQAKAVLDITFSAFTATITFAGTVSAVLDLGVFGGNMTSTVNFRPTEKSGNWMYVVTSERK